MNVTTFEEEYADIVETKAFNRLKKNLTTELLFLYILKLLEEKDYYGYELREELKEKFGLKLATVTSYVILYKMESEGLVIPKKKERKFGRPTRKYYTITEKGLRLLRLSGKFFRYITNLLFPENEKIENDNEELTAERIEKLHELAKLQKVSPA